MRLKYYPISLFNDMIAYMEKVINGRKIKDFQEKAKRKLHGKM